MLIQWHASDNVSSLCIQVRNEIRHLRTFKPRPRDAVFLHLLQHGGPVTPKRRHHRRAVESPSRQLRRFPRGLVMTGRTSFGYKYSPPRRGGPSVHEELLRPKISEQIPHLLRRKPRRGCSGLRQDWLMISHRRREFGQRRSMRAGGKIRYRVIATLAASGAEHCRSIRVADLKSRRFSERKRLVAKIYQDVG